MISKSIERIESRMFEIDAEMGQLGLKVDSHSAYKEWMKIKQEIIGDELTL